MRGRIQNANIAIKKNWRMSLVAIVFLVLIIALSLLLAGCGLGNVADAINVNDYVCIESTGYNEYGSVSLSVDYESMFNNAPVPNSTKKKVADAAEVAQVFIPQYAISDTLKNGDTVSVKWEKNSSAIKEIEEVIGVPIVCEDFEFETAGLEDVRDYNPFDDLCFDTKHTVSGNGAIDFQINYHSENSEISWNVEHDGENGKIKNGDVLNLKITDEIDNETMAREFGVRVSKTTDTVEVSFLGEYALDGKILQHIGDSERAAFDKVISDWVVTGLNDENLLCDDRTYKFEGCLYYANADETQTDLEPEEGMLFAIYKIDDDYVYGGYYVFIGLKGLFSYDDEGVYINNGEELPNSFMYYEKEHVRYAYESGWKQNCEPMGFLYMDLAYAGHMDIQDTFKYIDESYGKDYQYRYVDVCFEDVIAERDF